MAIIEVREFANAAHDGMGTVQAPAEPALAVHRLDTAGGAQTSPAFNQNTAFITIHANVDVAYEIAESSPNAASGAKRGTLYAASLPFTMGVAGGWFIQVNG